MPTQDGFVGPVHLPLPANTDEPIVDPNVVGLLNFLAFCAKHDVGDKVATMRGPSSSAPITDICPTGHRFPWNHHGGFMREHDVGNADNSLAVPLPGIWGWREGPARRAPEHSTTVFPAASKLIKVHYIFPHLQVPLGIRARSGLLNAIEDSWIRCSEQGYHEDYENGQQLQRLLKWRGWEMVSCEPGEAIVKPGNQVDEGRQRGEGATRRLYPMLEAVFRVVVRVDPPKAVLPQDANTDGTITFSVGDDMNNTLDILNAVLIGPVDQDDS
ncbi:MAG: hypothetical protein HOW73_47590 [Polyangiaceae bacterium]|nr:hypothetical protein [Polyangiaceae bacterium]